MLLVWRGKHLQDQFAGFHHHVAFPYSANLINNPGVGPMTLSSAYSTRTGAPRWSAEIWETIESGLLGLVFTWSLWWAVPRRRDILAGTLRCFALGFGLLSAALAVQAYDNEVLDRYYFPVVLAAALFLGSAHQGEAFSKRRDWGGRVLAGIAEAGADVAGWGAGALRRRRGLMGLTGVGVFISDRLVMWPVPGIISGYQTGSVSNKLNANCGNPQISLQIRWLYGNRGSAATCASSLLADAHNRSDEISSVFRCSRATMGR